MKKQGSEEELLGWLYDTRLGQILLSKIVIKPWFSKIMCHYYHTRLSKKKLQRFLIEHRIDIYKLPLDLDYHINREFKSFNDYFSRKEIRTTNVNIGNLISIADSFLSIYSISNELDLNIKSASYKVSELIGEDISDEYKGGTCLVFRLTLADYHRYVYFDNGRIKKSKKINGTLHTVRDIAQKYKVFAKNKREVTFLETENFGEAIQIEIGALFVGEIVNHKNHRFNFMDEKGYFTYSGSTIVLMLKQEVLGLLPEFESIRDKKIEKRVKIGDEIGYVKKIIHI